MITGSYSAAISQAAALAYASRYTQAVSQTDHSSRNSDPYPSQQTDSGVTVNGNNQTNNASDNLNELTPEEEQEVRELKKRDAEVRAHEQAHKSVGGQYAGSIQYSYTTGPDGKRYAVAGEVAIDATPIRDDPEATIRKMEIVIRAALAPADPSPQDQQVASQARQTKLQAQSELQKQRDAERNNHGASQNNRSFVSAAIRAYSKNNIDPASINSDPATEFQTISV